MQPFWQNLPSEECALAFLLSTVSKYSGTLEGVFLPASVCYCIIACCLLELSAFETQVLVHLVYDQKCG